MTARVAVESKIRDVSWNLIGLDPFISVILSSSFSSSLSSSSSSSSSCSCSSSSFPFSFFPFLSIFLSLSSIPSPSLLFFCFLFPSFPSSSSYHSSSFALNCIFFSLGTLIFFLPLLQLLTPALTRSLFSGLISEKEEVVESRSIDPP